MTVKNRHPYECPGCGRTVQAVAAWSARQRQLCRPCARVKNGWSCLDCGSSDPEHPSPCPTPKEIDAP